MKKKPFQSVFPPDVLTLIGSNTVLTGGCLQVTQDLRIEGRLECDVIVHGRAVVNAKASIQGHVEAEDMIIAGRIEGSLRIQGILHLKPTAIVEGEVYAGRLIVEEGAQLTGQCLMGDAPDRLARPPIPQHLAEPVPSALPVAMTPEAMPTPEAAPPTREVASPSAFEVVLPTLGDGMGDGIGDGLGDVHAATPRWKRPKKSASPSVTPTASFMDLIGSAGEASFSGEDEASPATIDAVCATVEEEHTASGTASGTAPAPIEDAPTDLHAQHPPRSVPKPAKAIDRFW